MRVSTTNNFFLQVEAMNGIVSNFAIKYVLQQGVPAAVLSERSGDKMAAELN